MRRLSLLPLLPCVLLPALLSACTSGGKDSAADDTGGTDSTITDPGGDFPLSKQRDIEGGWSVAYGGGTVPVGMLFVISFSADEGCPTIIEESDTRYEVQGGCDSADGIHFEGGYLALLDEAAGTITMTFTGFEMADDTASTLIDGTSVLADNVSSTDDLQITSTGVAAWPGLDGVKVSYSGVEMDVNRSGDASTGGPMRGSAVAQGVGRLSWDGTLDYGEQDCSGSLVGGEVVLSGSQDVTFRPAADCSTGCIPWEAADGSSGEVCD